jgi:hypothetical protein
MQLLLRYCYLRIKNNMEAARNLYLAVAFIGITNVPLELGTNFV